MRHIDVSLPLRLRPIVQHYSWGRQGAESLVARLAAQTACGKPCAELWYGTHKSGPALVCGADGETVSLDLLIEQFPGLILGQSLVGRFGAELPFLLKVLSVGEPLSIQCHPDASQAVVLHARDPLHYPDARHKPEMAIALSPGEVLYAFMCPAEIAGNIRAVPELAALISEPLRQEFAAAVQGLSCGNDSTLIMKLHREILEASSAAVRESAQRLYQRLAAQSALSDAERWIVALSARFPDGDVGIFHFYLMSLLKVQPGQALCFAPGILHAYLSGDWLECMACSDNTVRGGLTPKFIDRPSLLEICDYQPGGSPFLIPEPGIARRRCFAPAGIAEFVLEELSEAYGETEHQTRRGVELLFCLSGTVRLEARGNVLEMSSGEAVLIPAALSAYSLQIISGQACRVSSRTEVI